MKTRILVVDGSDLVLRVATQLAVRSGYDVTASASSGAEALEAANRAWVDVALVDLHLAGGPSGLELARTLSDRGARVVLLTGLPSPRSRALAEEVGATGLLPKPFGVGEFRRAVGDALAEGTRRFQVIVSG